jgi:M6 family metalloprotease-like protein
MKLVNIIAILLVISFAQIAGAVPACPTDTWTFSNDGIRIELKKWGDEFVHDYETLDGFTVVYDQAKDRWFYADLDENGILFSTNLLVGRDSPASFDLAQHLRFGKDYVNEIKKQSPDGTAPSKFAESRGTEAVTGNWKIPTLFIKFPNQAETFKTSEFYDHLYGTHPASPNSFTDYYDEISYGKFHITGDTVGWFTAAHDKAYYGANLPNGRDQNYYALVREAVEAADAYVNYSDYDRDKDGYVDNVFIIHSGRGEESSGATADDLWSRRGQLDPVYVSQEGTKVRDFSIQPEKLWSVKMTVGVFCHEFGHILGLPDLYDVDYSSNGVGVFCLMGFGSWNTIGDDYAGVKPAHMCSWAKTKLGWMNPTQISSDGTFNIASAEKNSICYKFNNNMPNLEYFMIENRELVSFDAGLPGNGGILIWHVDDNKVDDNTDENHKLVDLEQAQATQTLDLDPNSSNASQGSDADYFRQGKTFTDSTNPNSKTYSGTSTNLSITDISQIQMDKSMSFKAAIGSSTLPTGLKWKFKTEGVVESSPAVASDGTIYVGSADTYLYAVKPDGSLKWQFVTSGQIWSSPVIATDGTIYIGSNDNYIYAINPNGTLKWKYQTGDDVKAKPAIGPDGTILVGSYDGYFYALYPNGNLKWYAEQGLPISSSARIDNSGTIYCGSADFALYAAFADGTVKWEFDTDGGVYSKPFVGGDGTVYVGSDDYSLYAVNSNGTYKWDYVTGGTVESSPILANGTIYVGSADGYLYALNTNGTLKWRFKAKDVIYSSPAVGSDGTVYVGSDDFNFYAINSNGTLQWSYKTGNWIGSSPAIGPDGTVYIGSDDKYLYAFGKGSSINEKIDLTLKVSPSQASFSNGNTFNILLGMKMPAQSIKADIYFVMVPPGTPPSVYFGMNWTKTPVAIISNYSLPANLTLTDAQILRVTLPSIKPLMTIPGTYTYAIGAAKPGTFEFISNIASVNVIVK